MTLDAIFIFIVGFLQGFVGFALVFYLTKPIAKYLLKTHTNKLPITESFVLTSTFLFLFLAWFILGNAYLKLISTYSSIKPGRIYVIGMFVGLILYLLLPSLENRVYRNRSQ